MMTCVEKTKVVNTYGYRVLIIDTPTKRSWHK